MAEYTDTAEAAFRQTLKALDGEVTPQLLRELHVLLASQEIHEASRVMVALRAALANRKTTTDEG